MKEPEQKVVATAKKHKVLKKALVSLALVSAIGACVFLTACNKKDNDKTTNGVTPPTTQQGEQTGGNQGGQTGGNQGGNQGGQTGGQETGGNQGGQTGGNQGGQTGGQETGGNQGGQTGGQETGGNQGGETGGETGGNQGGETNPEKPADKTPAEYKAECEQKIVDALKTAMTGGRSDISAEIKDYKFNIQNGDLYSHSAIYRNGELRGNYFYKYTSNLNSIQNLSYKQISERLDNITLTNVEKVTNLKLSVSSDKYNALCNYVLGEYDLQDGEVLNVTKFKFGAGDGLHESITTVLYNGEIFTISAKTSAPNDDNSTVIDCLLGDEYRGQSVTITSRSAFKDFDNIVSAEAGISSYKVKLGGKTLFSKTNGNIVYNNDLGMGM